ncbi:hypothetical protein KXD93_15180 [Mucilaginibacter sp. BJC16-A38]|uniref:GH12 family glycosyl hydrolase domain-containing protein n=1 Tax=Mucilaginibacter phenanthrenivorans TaxID=1234842 RepID=UPI002158942F|nr:hypothetical protein [Mucilaginibacter phenanthrenivorans]MCR8558999.1 hypothetical protein [Mucilaginibacter phenanthrenivorans]
MGIKQQALLLLAMSCMAFACKKSSGKPQSTDPEVKANWSSSAQYGSWSNGGYTLNNDIWGSGAGAQSIWANSYSNWGVWANHPNTGGIKSYPNSSKYVGVTLSSLNSCTSSFNFTIPGSGAWEAAYDIWDSGNQNETMLWLNYTGSANGSGNVKPISYNYNANGNAVPVYTNVSVGGHTWNVYRGNNGYNNVYSFLRTSNTNSGTVDVKAIETWIKNQGWFGNITLGNVQFGFEITSSYGNNGSGLNFTCNSYSVSYN